MPRQHTRNRPAIRSVSSRLCLALCALALLLAPVSAVGASGPPRMQLAGLVRRYFADLNAHRYLAAFRLEATCGVTVARRLPGAKIVSRTFLPGRYGQGPPSTRNDSIAASLRFARAAHVSRLRAYSTPLFRHYHIIGFRVFGRFRFVFRLVDKPWADFGPTRYNLATVLVRMCDHRWEIDPNWPQGPPADTYGGP